METKTWEGQDGAKKSRTEIIAENMQMGPRAKSQEGGNYPRQDQADNQNNTGSQSAPQEKNPERKEENNKKSGNADNEEEIKIEDIPF